MKYEFIWSPKEEWPQEFLILECYLILSSQMICFPDQLKSHAFGVALGLVGNEKLHSYRYSLFSKAILKLCSINLFESFSFYSSATRNEERHATILQTILKLGHYRSYHTSSE
jgi:hypothetical protein